MKLVFNVSPIVRALVVFAIVASLVTGITIAALQGQATLTNNTIASASALLEVKSTGSFAAQDAGFAFTGVVPGGPAVPTTGNDFQLRNSGDVDLDIAASIPTAPTFTVTPSGTVDLTKVDLVLDCTAGTNSFSLTTDVAALVAAHGDGGVPMPSDPLPFSGDNVADCTAKVQMDSDAFTGSSASSTNFNIVFTGTPIAP